MDWHKRYLQQAAWTGQLRAYLFEKAGMLHADRVLEVGCGTGAILRDLQPPRETATSFRAQRFGLDIDPGALAQCGLHAPFAVLTRGNALALPFAAGTFQIAFCHFLLLWTGSPSRVLQEMKRVTRHGGHILALAEPDYSQRVDEPPELVSMGRWQTKSLAQQGADVSIGSRVADLFRQAGLEIKEAGCLDSSTDLWRTPEDLEIEWEVMEADLERVVPARTLARMKILEAQARRRGRRALHVPTYFAWGQV